jgi:hypothetical protein
VTAIGERLDDLSGADGEISPDEVVEDACDPSSPLHDEFEWNDAEAAHQYRLDQARYILRAFVSTWVEAGVEIEATSYVSLVEDVETPYREVRRVLSNKELRAQMQAQALKELREWRNRYTHIKELKDLFDYIDGLP